MVSMQGRTVLVTGATDGIGLQTATELAALGAQVLVHGRSQEKAARSVALILKEHPEAQLDTVVGDLASLQSVRTMAADVLARFPKLHVLLHNAGVFMKERVLTVDGLETTFAVNHLAPFLLTHLLLPRLKESAPARIINVSSIAHGRGRLSWDNLQSELSHEGYTAYAASKLCNVFFTQELARRLDGTGVTVNALHPGVIKTKLLKEGFGMNGGGSLASGAATSVFLASDPGVALVTGKYFVDSREAVCAQDQDAAARLWELSARLSGVEA